MDYNEFLKFRSRFNSMVQPLDKEIDQMNARWTLRKFSTNKDVTYESDLVDLIDMYRHSKKLTENLKDELIKNIKKSNIVNDLKSETNMLIYKNNDNKLLESVIDKIYDILNIKLDKSDNKN